MIWQKQDKIRASQEGRVEYGMDLWALRNSVSGVSTRAFLKSILSHSESKFFTKNMFPVFVWVNVSHFRLCPVRPSFFKSGWLCLCCSWRYLVLLGPAWNGKPTSFTTTVADGRLWLPGKGMEWGTGFKTEPWKGLDARRVDSPHLQIGARVDWLGLCSLLHGTHFQLKCGTEQGEEKCLLSQSLKESTLDLEFVT